MSPPYRRTCARCGNDRFAVARFPDGHICQPCLTRALKTRGICPGCGTEQLLIGRLAGDIAACRHCAGITREFSCRHCGYEGEHCRARLCDRCSLRRRLDKILDDGTGRPCPALAPLAAALHADPNLPRVLKWIKKPRNRAVLADLATGRTAITHAALAARPDRRTSIYLRDLLVDCGVLPAADRQLLDYEGWLHRRLATLADHPHERLLREFGLWHQLTTMRATAAARPLRPTARKYAEQRFRTAEVFLTWTHARGRQPAAITQADIDAFCLSHRIHHRQAIRAFLTWAIGQRHIPRLHVPVLRFTQGDAITQEQRLALLRRYATSDQTELGPRVAACLMLLHAQPLSRIIRLTTSDITHHGGQVCLLLGDPPAPVPEPFAAMLTEHAAAQPTGGWLFPGRFPGQPVHYVTMRRHLQDLGLTLRTARAAALRELVLQVPAPVAATALGFHHTTTQRQRAAAGGTWNQYAARPYGAMTDHLRPQPVE